MFNEQKQGYRPKENGAQPPKSNLYPMKYEKYLVEVEDE